MCEAGINLRWLGHVAKVKKDESVKRVYESKNKKTESLKIRKQNQ